MKGNTTGFTLSALGTSLLNLVKAMEATWPSGQRVGLAIRRSRVRIALRPLAGFVLGRPKFTATLVNSQLVASFQFGVFHPVMLYLNYLFLSI